MQSEEEKPNIFTRFKSFVKESKRVFRITKKPNMKEFKVIVKVTAIGIAIIGILGFLIQMTWILIKWYSQ